MTWTDLHGRALAKVFASLDLSGIQWLVLRNHEGLPWHNQSKDIDLGIKLQDIGKAEKIISQSLRLEGFDRRETEVFQWGRCSSYYGIFDGRPYSIKIDLMDGFYFRGAHVYSASVLHANHRLVKGIRIPNEIDGAIMLWIKSIVTGGRIKSRYVREIGSIIRCTKPDPDVLKQILPKSTHADVWSMITRGRSEIDRKQLSYLRTAIWQHSFVSGPIKTLRETWRHFRTEVARRIVPKKASFLAVAGPDGVGKTTFIAQFTQSIAELKNQDESKIVYLHFRPHILPNINELLGGKAEDAKEFHDPHKSQPARLFSSMLRIIYYWLDFIVGYFCKLRNLRAQNHTIIFDRYFFDFVVDPRRSRLSLPNWMSVTFYRLTPKPEFIFFLDADPKLIYERKQELPVHEIDRQLKAYRSLAAADPKRFICLDARKAAEEIVQDALRELVVRSYDHIETDARKPESY